MVCLIAVVSLPVGSGCGADGGGNNSGKSSPTGSAFLVGRIGYVHSLPDSLYSCSQPNPEPPPTGAFPAEVFVFPAGSGRDTAYARPLAYLWTSTPSPGRLRRFRVSGLTAPDTVDIIVRADGWDAAKEADLVLKPGRNEVALTSSYLPEVIEKAPDVALRRGVAESDFKQLLASIGPGVTVQDTVDDGLFRRSRGPYLNVSVTGAAAKQPQRMAARLVMSPLVLGLQVFQDFPPPCPTV